MGDDDGDDDNSLYYMNVVYLFKFQMVGCLFISV